MTTHDDFDVWWSQQVNDPNCFVSLDVKKPCSVPQGKVMLLCMKAFREGKSKRTFCGSAEGQRQQANDAGKEF